jgi:hypothetical protein
MATKCPAFHETLRFINTYIRACILSPMKPVHNISYSVKTHFNIILPSMIKSSKWSLPSKLYDQNFVLISHFILLDFIILIFCEEYKWMYEALHHTIFSSLCHLTPPSSSFSSAPHSQKHTMCSSFKVREQISHPYKTPGIVCYCYRVVSHKEPQALRQFMIYCVSPSWALIIPDSSIIFFVSSYNVFQLMSNETIVLNICILPFFLRTHTITFYF